MTSKVCGPSRATKKYPLVWSKEELVEKAVAELGFTKTAASKTKKSELCHLLGLPAPLLQELEQVLLPPSNAKICTKKRNVPRFSRTELEMAASALGKTKKEIRAMSYDALCAFLKFPTSLPSPVAPPPPPVAAASQALVVASDPTVPPCIARSNKALREHQKAVCRYMDKHRGLIVFHKVGSGKTLTAITVSQCYLDKYPTHRVLVVAPAGLLNNFKDEMTKSYVNIHHADRYEFYSYQRFTSLVKKHKKPVCRNTLVMIDEGHNLRTPFQEGKNAKNKNKGVNTKNILDCARLANKVLILTGTPIYNSRNDIFTLFNMIRDPSEPEIPKASYGTKDKEVGEASFRRLFCKISYHDTLGDPNFPDRINVRHSIEMTPVYKAKYMEVIETIQKGGIDSALVKNLFGEKNLVPFFNAVRRAVNNLDNTDANRKLQWLVQTLQKFPRNEKAIVFSNFLDAGLRLVTAKLPPSVSYAMIEGKVPMAKRKEIVKDFNEGKYSVLFISKAGGEGLDMKGVRHVILMDPTWNEASNEQVIGRAIRYRSHSHLPDKAHHNVTVHYLQHIFPEDRPLVKEVDDYLKKVQQDPSLLDEDKPEVSPYENSFDLFLSYFLRLKQVKLDKYNELLKSYSIERNQC
jgi:superfamily II DNA or RNA helicase